MWLCVSFQQDISIPLVSEQRMQPTLLVAVIREFKPDTSLCGGYAGSGHRVHRSTLSAHSFTSPFQYGDQARNGRYLRKVYLYTWTLFKFKYNITHKTATQWMCFAMATSCQYIAQSVCRYIPVLAAASLQQNLDIRPWLFSSDLLTWCYCTKSRWNLNGCHVSHSHQYYRIISPAA